MLHFNAKVALWQKTILCGRTVGQEVRQKQDIMPVSIDCLMGVKVLIFQPFKCVSSSIGRASPCHGEGRRFETVLMLHKLPDSQAQTVRDAR